MPPSLVILPFGSRVRGMPTCHVWGERRKLRRSASWMRVRPFRSLRSRPAARPAVRRDRADTRGHHTHERSQLMVGAIRRAV